MGERGVIKLTLIEGSDVGADEAGREGLALGHVGAAAAAAAGSRQRQRQR